MGGFDMYLFDKKDNGLEVYRAREKEQEAHDFREEKMTEFSSTPKILTAQELPRNPKDLPLFELYAKQFDQKIIPSKELRYLDVYSYRTLQYEDRSMMGVWTKDLLNKFYFGHYSEKNIARVKDHGKLKYLLLPDGYIRFEHTNVVQMRRILEIPQSLFLLQMLEQGKTGLLEGQDISEQLELFDIEKVDEIDLEQLKKSDQYLGIRNLYDNALTKSERDGKVLRLVKGKK